MAKIGRNEPCICGSGKKYKKCCHLNEIEKSAASKILEVAADEPSQEKLSRKAPGKTKTIQSEVEKIKKVAFDQRLLVMTSGVLILFSTEDGDSWLLETTGKDALQLTDKGKELEILIEESHETTTVEWSHTFSLKKSRFTVTSYKDKKETVYGGYPANKIVAAMKGIKKRIPADLAGMIHVPSEEEKKSAAKS